MQVAVGVAIGLLACLLLFGYVRAKKKATLSKHGLELNVNRQITAFREVIVIYFPTYEAVNLGKLAPNTRLRSKHNEALQGRLHSRYRAWSSKDLAVEG